MVPIVTQPRLRPERSSPACRPEAFTAGAGYTATNGMWKGCMDQRVNLADPNDPFDITTADTSPTVKPFYKSFIPSTAGDPATGVQGVRFYDNTNRRYRFMCSTSSSTSSNSGGIRDCDSNWGAGTGMTTRTARRPTTRTIAGRKRAARSRSCRCKRARPPPRQRSRRCNPGTAVVPTFPSAWPGDGAS